MASTPMTKTLPEQVIDIDPIEPQNEGIPGIPMNQLHPTGDDEEDQEYIFEKLEGLEDGGET